MKHNYNNNESGINYRLIGVSAIMIFVVHVMVLGVFLLMDALPLLESALSSPIRIYIAEGIIWGFGVLLARVWLDRE